MLGADFLDLVPAGRQGKREDVYGGGAPESKTVWALYPLLYCLLVLRAFEFSRNRAV